MSTSGYSLSWPSRSMSKWPVASCPTSQRIRLIARANKKTQTRRPTTDRTTQEDMARAICLRRQHNMWTHCPWPHSDDCKNNSIENLTRPDADALFVRHQSPRLARCIYNSSSAVETDCKCINQRKNTIEKKRTNCIQEHARPDKWSRWRPFPFDSDTFTKLPAR